MDGISLLSVFVALLIGSISATALFSVLITRRKSSFEMKTVVQTVRRRPVSVISRIEGAKKCSVCLGIIKRELMGIDCACGCSFHKSCAMRIGLCPVCGGEIDISDFEATSIIEPFSEPVRSMPLTRDDRLFLLEDRLLLGEIDGEAYERLKPDIMAAMPEPAHCARCGRKLYPGERCQCIDSDYQECPECGYIIDLRESFCRSCGVVLSEDFSEELFQCSECFRIVSSTERVCSCGAILLDPGDSLCSDCEHPVSPLDRSCPNCGRIRILETFVCPSCGNEVCPDDFECDCGAIFQDMIERIECPSCNSGVDLEDRFCRGCGIRFSRDRISSVKR